MKIHQLLLFLYIAISANAAEDVYVLTLADAPATLNNGIQFTMEKGDYYPVVGLDASQTLVQLKLGPYTFWARKTNLVPVSNSDAPRAAAKYTADATRFLTMLAAEIRRLQQQQEVIAAEESNRIRNTGQRLNALDEDAQRQPAQTVRPNGYGLGVNTDEYGRPHTYRTRDGERLSPIFQDDVKRDAYGLGVHSDQFGRPVRDSKP